MIYLTFISPYKYYSCFCEFKTLTQQQRNPWLQIYFYPHIFWSRWPTILSVLCTSVHLLCATSYKLMFVSPLFLSKCLTNVSHGPTQESLMSENPQCFCFLFSCPVSWCYYLSISSQDHGWRRLLEQMITVRDLTSPFVAHIITPTQAYMCTLTNIVAVLPFTQQHTHKFSLKTKDICPCFLSQTCAQMLPHTG